MIRANPTRAVLILACLIAAGAARADEPVSARHAAWQACLADAFALRAALSSRPLAAEAAFRECRTSESAYLAALSASPLVDADDVARVRPALLVRARTRLLAEPGRAL